MLQSNSKLSFFIRTLTLIIFGNLFSNFSFATIENKCISSFANDSTERTPLKEIARLRTHLNSEVIGQKHLINSVLVALLINGGILVEGPPGVAKTRTIKTLADSLAISFGRIQGTSELMPSDITGSQSLNFQTHQLEYHFGPAFNNLLLFDEINRANSKTQSALLQAMEEREISIGGVNHKLPEVFMVMATLNPSEHQGTYPLTPALIDRFLLKIEVDYPNREHELNILNLAHSEWTIQNDNKNLNFEKLGIETILKARSEIGKIKISNEIIDHILNLVIATRPNELTYPEISRKIEEGVSSRGAILLQRVSMAYAWLQGRDEVTRADIDSMVLDVFRGRIKLTNEALSDGTTVDSVVNEIIQKLKQ